jgi:hypothetical protein
MEVKVFKKRIKDYYEKLNCTVRFERLNDLEIIYTVYPRENNICEVCGYNFMNT